MNESDFIAEMQRRLLGTIPAAALDSPVLETPTQGDGSNSIDKENA